jgi:hypothetical protein
MVIKMDMDDFCFACGKTWSETTVPGGLGPDGFPWCEKCISETPIRNPGRDEPTASGMSVGQMEDWGDRQFAEEQWNCEMDEMDD